jgi:hypothetical protein
MTTNQATHAMPTTPTLAQKQQQQQSHTNTNTCNKLLSTLPGYACSDNFVCMNP